MSSTDAKRSYSPSQVQRDLQKWMGQNGLMQTAAERGRLPYGLPVLSPQAMDQHAKGRLVFRCQAAQSCTVVQGVEGQRVDLATGIKSDHGQRRGRAQGLAQAAVSMVEKR